MQRDLYVALGVARSETASGIRAAFRDLAKRYHPDRTGPGGADTFREIIDAYLVLSDPPARARYDATLDGCDAPDVEQTSIVRRRPKLLSLHDGEAIQPGLEPLLARVARNFTGLAIPKGERVERLSLDVHLSEEEAARGAVVQVGMPVFRRCASCSGLGGTLLLQCGRCLGAGLVEAMRPLALEIPAGIKDGTELFMPLVRFGIQNFYACVHVSIDRYVE